MLPYTIYSQLEHLAFPECAKRALRHLDVNLGQVEVLLSKYIFMDHPDAAVRRSRPPPPLQPIEELQLIELIMELFQEPGTEAARNAIFLAVFERYLNPMRVRILGRLVSISISCGMAPVLRAAGVWMNQMGANWPEALEVARMLVTDFTQFCFKPKALLELAVLAPRLAVNLMSAFGVMYLQKSKDLIPPPDTLLDLVIHWVKNYPEVCMTWKQPIELPEGVTTRRPVTPFAGLFRWTIFGPIVAPKLKYVALHLLLLKIVVEHKDAKGEAINVDHLAFVARQLRYIAEARAAEQFTATDTFDGCMDRMAQAAHFALATKHTMRHKWLIRALRRLPPHGVMEIVLQHKQSEIKLNPNSNE